MKVSKFLMLICLGFNTVCFGQTNPMERFLNIQLFGELVLHDSVVKFTTDANGNELPQEIEEVWYSQNYLDTSAQFTTTDTNFFFRDYTEPDTVIIRETQDPLDAFYNGWTYKIFNDSLHGEEILRLNEIHPFPLASLYSTIKYDQNNRVDSIYTSGLDWWEYLFFYNGPNARPDSVIMNVNIGAGYDTYLLRYHNTGNRTDSVSVFVNGSNQVSGKIRLLHNSDGKVTTIDNTSPFRNGPRKTVYFTKAGSVLAVNQPKRQRISTVFPNPTNGSFSVDLGQKVERATVTVTDLAGKLMSSSTYANQKTLKLSLDAPAGMYLVRINAGANEAVVRLVVKE